MPYEDPSYSAEPEPKLLATECFPTFSFFTPPAPPPPDYQVIMAANTQYHRLPEDNSASFEAPRDAELLLPLSVGENPTPPKKERKFSYQPTLFLRIVVVALLIASLVLFITARRPRSLSAIIFVCIVLTRNVLVVVHYLVARFIRIRVVVELRNKPKNPRKQPAKGCPSWLKKGPIHILLDLILAFLLLITVIIATQGSYHWNQRSVIPACILAWVAIPLYIVSAADMGKPNTITGTISFDYGKEKKSREPGPQVYRDVEAAGGLGLESRKTGADSPVII